MSETTGGDAGAPRDKWLDTVLGVYDSLILREGGISLKFDDLAVTLAQGPRGGEASPPTQVHVNGRLTIEARQSRRPD